MKRSGGGVGTTKQTTCTKQVANGGNGGGPGQASKARRKQEGSL